MVTTEQVVLSDEKEGTVVPERIASTITYTQVQKLFDSFAKVRCLSQETEKLNKNGNQDDLTSNETVKINTFLIQRNADGGNKIGYWENRWATGQSQWHKKDINP